ncbi:MAG: hypothetical protein GY722_26205 [bacterium]|nr:hypothetical protein [bacterium]
MARKRERPQFGELPPRYDFSLNPYPKLRFTSCPQCHAKTGQRKLPLLIHVDPGSLIALNYTNRYCKNCDLLIGHKHEIEQHLTELFRGMDPSRIGNAYLIFATVEKKAWRENMKEAKGLTEMLEHTSDFKRYEELRMAQGGWCREDQDPPAMEPGASTEWVKR